MKEVIYVNEEQLFLTREEAEYSRFVSLLTSRAAAGTDIGNKANVLMSRLMQNFPNRMNVRFR